MIDRRSFAALLASAFATPRTAWSQITASKVSLLRQRRAGANSLSDRHQMRLRLTLQGTVMLPANIQYAWPHPSAPHFLYVASSDGGSASRRQVRHALFERAAHRSQAVARCKLTARRPRCPHARSTCQLDRIGAFALVAYFNPSSVTVHRINADGTIGEEVKQAAVLDSGIFAHQIRATPANDAIILVTRGNDAAGGKPEDPGALKVFSFKDGQLANRASIAPNGGYGFGPRHLDFHPTLPVVYVSRERENKLRRLSTSERHARSAGDLR